MDKAAVNTTGRLAKGVECTLTRDQQRELGSERQVTVTIYEGLKRAGCPVYIEDQLFLRAPKIKAHYGRVEHVFYEITGHTGARWTPR